MTGPGFAIIDLETTGLLPSAHERVVEASPLEAEGRALQNELLYQR